MVKKILITNDDGIDAEGILALEKIANNLGFDPYIVAPATNQSGIGRAVSLSKEINLIKISDKKFSITGTPVDCVILGLHEMFDIDNGVMPDLILSGINIGQNIGYDITYSGTVGAAIEGILYGVPSIAISQQIDFSKEDAIGTHNWDKTADIGTGIIKEILEKDMLSKKAIININIPSDMDNIKGTKIVRQGIHYSKYNHMTKINYRRFRIGDRVIEPSGDHDVEALDQGYITITPLHKDWTSNSIFEQISKKYKA